MLAPCGSVRVPMSLSQDQSRRPCPSQLHWLCCPRRTGRKRDLKPHWGWWGGGLPENAVSELVIRRTVDFLHVCSHSVLHCSFIQCRVGTWCSGPSWGPLGFTSKVFCERRPRGRGNSGPSLVREAGNKRGPAQCDLLSGGGEGPCSFGITTSGSFPSLLWTSRKGVSVGRMGSED